MVCKKLYQFFSFVLIFASVRGQTTPDTTEAQGSPPGTSNSESEILPEDVAAVKACRDKILLTNPQALQRYSESTLNTMCTRSAVWQRTVASNKTKDWSNRMNFTESQLSWLQSLFKCPDTNCICERSNACASMDPAMNESQRVVHKIRSKRQRFPVDQSLPNHAGRAVRREIRQMTDDDRWRYFRAVNRMKDDFIDGMSKYNILILYHTPEYSPEAHFSAALLPYHREMLKNYELALRMYDPGAALPYWDSTVDAPLPNPADSVLWTGNFYGNGFGDVRNGPFGNWFAMPDSELGQLTRSGRLARNLGRQGSLMDEGDVQTILRKPRFRNLVWCVDSFTELAHGANHMWVGGHMGPLRLSPNDPLFYSLHAFIDLIWENWRQSHQGYQQRENEYVNNFEACNWVSRFNAQMQPFQLSNGDGLSNRYTEVFYSYSHRPSCPDCGLYLFCDNRWNHCISKIRMGGNCRGFDGMDACANGQCVNGRCVQGGSRGGDANDNNDNVNQNQGGDCQNNHACCAQWSRSGECDRNQAWMRSNCPAACGVCAGGNNGCTDTLENCATWASNGECQSNAAWMSVGCPLSCNTCNGHSDGAQCHANTGSSNTAATQAATGSVARSSNVQLTGNQCRNSDRHCSQWARNGQCRRNPDWMNVNCARACHAC